MIVVDTSVWVSVFRRRTSREADPFAALLDSDEVLLPAPVRTELLGGARPVHRQVLRRILGGLGTIAVVGVMAYALPAVRAFASVGLAGGGREGRLTTNSVRTELRLC